MKLLVISNMYPSRADTTYGTFVAAFVEQMTCLNSGGQTDIIVLRGRDGGKMRKVWKYVKFYVATVLTLLFCKYDLVYVHTITHTILPIKLALLFRRFPLVLNVHGGDVLTRGNLAARLKELASSVVEKQARLVVSPSHFFKDILLREFPGLDANRIFISPSGGVPLSFFLPKSSCNALFTIGYVSRISEAKGWDTFLQAVAQIVAGGAKCRVIMAGCGEEQAQMEQMIKDLSLSEVVDYIGPVPNSQLPGVYSRLDVFVFPTCLEESLGLVGLEAMAVGIPVIGSRIGGLTDYIQDGVNGYFYAPGNVDELAKQLKYFISLSEADKAQLSANAIHTARQYEAEEAARRLYAKLCETI